MHLHHPTRSRPPRRIRLAFATMAALLASVCAPAQQAPTAQTPSADTPETAAPHGTVLFEHHEAAPGSNEPAQEATPAQSTPPTLRRRIPAANTSSQTLSQAAQDAETSSSQADADAGNVPILITPADREAAGAISNADRSAVTITATALDLHLNTHTGDTEARAQLTVRNTGTQSLQHLPLRISGALHWESARLNGTAQTISQYHLADDLDHTGAATELVLNLQQPLPPGATVALDLYYAGTLTTNTQRLLALGAPGERALRADWDTVSDTFTGLRGLGNVLWYPVSEPPATLREGDAVPATVEHARLANATTSFALHLTLLYTGAQPAAAFFCGHREPLQPLTATRETEGGAVTADWKRSALGPHTPSLFITQAAPHTVSDGLIRAVTGSANQAVILGEAVEKLRPMLEEWLGPRPSRPLDIIDLPIPGASGFSDDALVVASLTGSPAASLAAALVGPLTSAWLPPNIEAPWLREGIPTFLQAVWSERTAGRTAALNGLAAQRAQLAATQANPPALSSSSFGDDDAPPRTAPPPLATCTDPACSRSKAAAVLEMLRTMLGDAALQQALSGWRIAQEHANDSQNAQPLLSSESNNETNPQSAAITTASLAAQSETASFEALLQRVAGKRDLTWFFQSWIDAGHGLPELSIVTVAPRRVERNAPTNYLPPKQAVGGPIGPEPVPQPGDPESTASRSTTPGNKVAPAPGSWLVAVEVQNSGDTDAEVPVTVRSGSLTNTLPLRIPAHSRATVRVPFEADPEEVLVNDGTVPETTGTTQHRRTLNSTMR